MAWKPCDLLIASVDALENKLFNYKVLLSAMALKLHVNLQKYCTNPELDCIYFTVVGTGHLFKLHTFDSLMHMSLGMTLKPRNIVCCIRSCTS